MKKLILLTLIASMALSAFMLVSCGGKKDVDYSDSKYVGTWRLSELTVMDESDGLGSEWTLEFKADGTGESVSQEETTHFTWEPVDGGVKTKGDVKMKFKDDGDNIVGNMFGVKLIFEKK